MENPSAFPRSKHRNKWKQKQAIPGQGQNKRTEPVLEQCKENHLSEHKGGEPGGTSASLDCGPRWQLTAAALTSCASRCGSNFPNAATLNFTLVPRSLCSAYLHVNFGLIRLLNCITSPLTKPFIVLCMLFVEQQTTGVCHENKRSHDICYTSQNEPPAVSQHAPVVKKLIQLSANWETRGTGVHPSWKLVCNISG